MDDAQQEASDLIRQMDVTVHQSILQTTKPLICVKILRRADGVIKKAHRLSFLNGMDCILSLATIFASLLWSGIWQSAGYSCIMYLAALTSVSHELHEAAIVDGANKLQRIVHIDFMCILPTAIILFILNMGSILNVGFEKAYLMQTDLNLSVSEIISTYVYKIGITKAQFSYSTAIGLFNNVINFTLLLIVNRISGRLTGTSLW